MVIMKRDSKSRTRSENLSFYPLEKSSFLSTKFLAKIFDFDFDKAIMELEATSNLAFSKANEFKFFSFPTSN